ncbi:MAG: glycosyltransferase family 4 protein [Polaromonas sp.]
MRILLVSANYPNDMSFGAGQRTTMMHHALKQVGEVTTLVLKEGRPLNQKLAPAADVAAEISYPETILLQKYSRVSAIEPLINAVVNINSFDLVIGREFAPLLALPRFRGRSIIDADDAYYRYPAGDKATSRLMSAIKTRGRLFVGQRALRRVDHAWFCCERDQKQSTLRSSSILPNVVGTTTVAAESVRDAEPIVLMVGALWYQPNREAIERFLQLCWPKIRRQMPRARFRAVGAAPLELRQRWASVPGVECPGFVDDLSAEYRRASLTVVPVISGGGTQIKALESLAHGRVPIVSSFVASGFAPHLTNGESFYVVDDQVELSECVIALLKNPSAGEALARRGQQIVEEKFSHQCFIQAVRTTIESFAGRTKSSY